MQYSEQANIAKRSVTVNIKFTLEQTIKPHTRRDLALLLLQPDAKYGWVVNAATWPLYFLECTKGLSIKAYVHRDH